MTKEQAMRQRISRAAAAGTVLLLPLLGACGGGTDPQSGSAAPAASSAAAPSTTTTAPAPTPAATPSQPADETESARAAATALVKAFLAYDSSESYAEYRDAIKPLMTKAGFASFEAAHFDEATAKFRSRYGQQARTKTRILGTPKVTGLTADSATVTVKYESHIEQRRDGKWRTVRTSSDDQVKVPVVKQDGRWLVDDLS